MARHVIDPRIYYVLISLIYTGLLSSLLIFFFYMCVWYECLYCASVCLCACYRPDVYLSQYAERTDSTNLAPLQHPLLSSVGLVSRPAQHLCGP